MSMQTLTWDVDAAAVAGNSDAYGLALATQARQKQPKSVLGLQYTIRQYLNTFVCSSHIFNCTQLELHHVINSYVWAAGQA